MGRKITLFVIAAACAGLCGFLIFAIVTKGLDRAGAWAVPLGTITAAVAAGAALWALMPQREKPPLPPELEVPDGVIPRAAEVTPVVKALTRRRTGKAGITVGLSGAGGFGKTTLAQMVCADRRVKRRFAGGIYPVTVGRDVRGAAAIAAKVNDVIKLVSGEDAAITDPQLAGRWLGSLLNVGPRKLLVVDDVATTAAAPRSGPEFMTSPDGKPHNRQAHQQTRCQPHCQPNRPTQVKATIAGRLIWHGTAACNPWRLSAARLSTTRQAPRCVAMPPGRRIPSGVYREWSMSRGQSHA